ncbi:WSCD family member AAEL009094-like isoform X2 [Mytilus trossulus]|uniref:WSCD family member AAEL009094-like isoform X2 n=1 Tax=Mytilus trossulus TaxID=6551 RepID=UPI0030050624
MFIYKQFQVCKKCRGTPIQNFYISSDMRNNYICHRLSFGIVFSFGILLFGNYAYWKIPLRYGSPSKHLSHAKLKVSCPEVQFSVTHRPLTALASFPGSGNTWARHLIEQSTGIATGSIYCSDTIKKDFIGECSVSSNVAVIKTHVAWANTVRMRYKKSVLLIRNPYDAIIAEFNRVFANKTTSATEQQFAEKFEPFALKKIDKWKKCYNSWMKFSGQKYIFIYEEMKKDPVSQIGKLLDFLNISKQIRTFPCMQQNIAGRYRRHHSYINFNPKMFYTKILKVKLNAAIEQIEKHYGELNYSINNEMMNEKQ